MGFHIEVNSILRSDDAFTLARGSEHPFRKEGSRIFFDDIPIWLTRSDWTALAEIRVTSQTRSPEFVAGTFRVIHVYSGAEQEALTVAFRRMFAGGTDPFIYLTLNVADYEQASRDGTWSPPSLKTEGFIHASPANQLERVANKHFAQFDEIRIVVLRADRVAPEIRWEPATGGLYPHLFGPLNLDATERIVAVKKGPDGRFVVPIPVV